MKHQIDINLLENNSGQLKGVNQNPRDLTQSGFEKAKNSIRDFPEMLEVRSLVVVPYKNKYVVVGGNQRLRALKALGYTNAPCHVVEWSSDRINEFIVKDNLEYGEWNFDLLANEWDAELLVDWGMDLPVNFGDEEELPKIIDNMPDTFGINIETNNKAAFENIKEELDRLKIGYNEYEK